MEREYTVYRITSPSERMYYGYTSMRLCDRWHAHVQRAMQGQAPGHPFYDEIRKYGAKAFLREPIEKFPSIKPALARERQMIAGCPVEKRLNLSPGGQDDARFGGMLFWERLNASPVEKAAYCQKLSAAKLANNHTDYVKLALAAQQWRKEHAREAYYASHRAIRIASRGRRTKREYVPETQEERKRRLMWKYQRAEMIRRNTTKQWARRSDEERASVGRKIALTNGARMAAITDLDERRAITEKARAAIDRKKQGAAASAGLKAFWESLRADPVRYKAYIEQRKATLAETWRRKNANL